MSLLMFCIVAHDRNDHYLLVVFSKCCEYFSCMSIEYIFRLVRE